MDQIKTKRVTAKTFIRALLGVALVVWIITDTYMFSSKSSPTVYNYDQILQVSGEKISKNIAIAAKFNPHSQQLISLCCLLCEIKLCQKDPLLTKDELPTLFNIADDTINNYNRSALSMFVGNIYRDCGNYDLAKASYQQSINSVNTNSANSDGSVNQLDSQIIKARNLNNLGVLHYLQGKMASNKEESSRNYLLAKDCFAQANTFISTGQNLCLSQTIQNNMQQCLGELKFIN